MKPDTVRAVLAAAATLMVTAPARAQSYSDPAGSSVFVAAVNWLQGTLLGTIATTVAIIAIASVGFLMFTGRIDIRRAAQVIFG